VYKARVDFVFKREQFVTCRTCIAPSIAESNYVRSTSYWGELKPCEIHIRTCIEWDDCKPMIRIVIVLYAHTVAMRIMWSVVPQELHLAT
jgi:hypothetical protein